MVMAALYILIVECGMVGPAGRDCGADTGSLCISGHEKQCAC